MCAKDNLIRQKSLLQLAEKPAIAESITAKELLIARGNISNTNILSLIAFIISHRPFADKLNIQQSLPDRATVVLIIISVNKTQLSLISGDRSTPSTLLAKFIPITKIRNPLLKSQVYYYCIGKLLSPLENAAKSKILLACADRRTRQYYLTIYAILANYEEQKHYNFNIHVSLATDTLHLLLKSLVIKMLDFMQDMLNDIYPSTIVSLLFISKAPFALYFIRAVYDLVILAQYKSHNEDTLAYIQGALERINIFKKKFQVYQQTLEEEKNFNYSKALNSICTRANSKAHYITIVKQFYSITNKKDKRHNDPKHCNEEVLYLILIIINYTCYDKDRKYIAYIRAFSKNAAPKRQTLQAFKFYDLSTIIRLVHLVLRDLPNLTTHEYNCLYSPIFNINLLRTLREYQQKQTQNN
ncbi:hypothetical protein HBI56_117740 [Parastagonospora nodorum]|nr:hypothetical protein HBI56_117740 [Parastagonospora nodorum]